MQNNFLDDPRKLSTLIYRHQFAISCSDCESDISETSVRNTFNDECQRSHRRAASGKDASAALHWASNNRAASVNHAAAAQHQATTPQRCIEQEATAALHRATTPQPRCIGHTAALHWARSHHRADRATTPLSQGIGQQLGNHCSTVSDHRTHDVHVDPPCLPPRAAAYKFEFQIFVSTLRLACG